MLIRRAPEIPNSEITDPQIYSSRRDFVRTLALGLGAASLGLAHGAESREGRGSPFGNLLSSPLSTRDDKLTPYQSMTTYGNFYEFGPDKDSPAKNAHRLRTQPWTVTIDGEVKTPKTFAIEDILKWAQLEERIYRLRCVEGWSAVVPWVGFSFNELLKRVEPTGNAKFVEFWSLADPEQMPYVRIPLLDWPYVEALRLDEARHPLTLLAVGMYGEVMPKQNGAPLRLIVPWKYGFKGAKSIVRIRFVEKQPQT
ncbi:MAG: protein-methionine-sulfoxide reductase catalytic subunit MsrP, partial [Dechloromonas sp.]|nr:protein-methionine-sulfoxide reductase catalytic subunit MsrP [Dechloromonas sp.]